jgi:hypothetical protein
VQSICTSILLEVRPHPGTWPGLHMASLPPSILSVCNILHQTKLAFSRYPYPSSHEWQLQYSEFWISLPNTSISVTNYFRIEKLLILLFTVFLAVLNKFRREFLHKISELIFRHIHDILYRKDWNWKYGFEKNWWSYPEKRATWFSWLYPILWIRVKAGCNNPRGLVRRKHWIEGMGSIWCYCVCC